MGVVRRWIDIERAIRAAVKNGNHRPTELYMDSSFFNSLNLAFDFEKNAVPRFLYDQPRWTTRPLSSIELRDASRQPTALNRSEESSSPE